MSSLGWLAESSVLPRKPKQIDEVGKASMVDLRAAVYATEEKLKRPEELKAEERRRRSDLRTAGPLGVARNSGVAERSAADDKYEREEGQRIKDALARKAALYDQMARGEADVATRSDGLVDFELKHLSEPRPGLPGSTGASEFAPPPNAERMEASRLAWERSSHEELRAGKRAAETDAAHAAGAPKRHAEEAAVSRQTEACRAAASEQKGKRQRALDDRRALLRLKQEERERSQRPPEPTPAASAAEAEAPLPAGWKETTAPDGRSYYWYKAVDGTKKTQWRRPTASPGAVMGAVEPAAAPPVPSQPPPLAWPPMSWPPPSLPPPSLPPHALPPHALPPHALPPHALPPHALPPPPPAYAAQWHAWAMPPPPPPHLPAQQANGSLSTAEMMQSMGLPAAFTSQRKEREEEREEQQQADEARVRAVWERFSPYGR